MRTRLLLLLPLAIACGDDDQADLILAQSERIDALEAQLADITAQIDENTAATSDNETAIEANTEAAALACPELTELMPHGERLATWFGEDREVLV